MWLWWQLVSKNADSKFIDNWQLYKGDVDWDSKILTNSVNTINDWLDKGFISRNATGMKAEDTTQAFIKGEYPIYQTGTWNQGRFVKQITSFDWDAAVMPESNFAIGCAGNLLVIPESRITRICPPNSSTTCSPKMCRTSSAMREAFRSPPIPTRLRTKRARP